MRINLTILLFCYFAILQTNYNYDEADFIEFLRNNMMYEAKNDQVSLFQGKGSSDFEGRRTGVGMIRCATHAEANKLANDLHRSEHEKRVIVSNTFLPFLTIFF